MTCVAGLVHKGKVWMGADAAGTDGRYGQVVRNDPKIIINGTFLIGFTSSYRMGQLLMYVLNPPEIRENQDIMMFMVGDFINSVRECLKTGGYAIRKDEEETGGTFLVGYKGNLFTIEEDYQVGVASCGYSAVGCGDHLALGSLRTTAKLNVTEPKKRLTLALEAADDFSAGVKGPFSILSL